MCRLGLCGGKRFVWWVMRDTSDWRWFFADCGGMGEILAGMKDEVLFETFWNNHQDPQTNAFWLVLWIVQVGRLGLRHLSNTIDWPLPWSNLFMSEVGKERGSPEHPQSRLLFLGVFDVQQKGFLRTPSKGAKVNSIHRLRREAINSCANAHMCASQKRGRGLQSGSKATKQSVNSFLGMSLQAPQRSLFHSISTSKAFVLFYFKGLLTMDVNPSAMKIWSRRQASSGSL